MFSSLDDQQLVKANKPLLIFGLCCSPNGPNGHPDQLMGAGVCLLITYR